MALEQLKFHIAIATLKTWEKVYETYKVIKNNKLYALAIVSLIFALGVYLLISNNSGSVYNSLGYNPYELLNVTKETSEKDIKRQFRKLSRTFHPDLIEGEKEKDEARKMFIKLQKAQEILLDETKRENWEKYGDPDPQWWATQFPTWVLNPGKGFLLFYASMGALLMVLPFTILLLIPGLNEPPQWIRSNIYYHINLAEQSLIDEQYDQCKAHLEDAQKMWKQVRKQFPNYKESVWYGAIDFHIVARMCQSYLFQNQISKAVSLIQKFALVHNKKTTLENVEAQAMIYNHVQDLKNTCKDLSSSGTTSTTSAVNSKKKKKSSATTPTSPASGNASAFDFMQVLKDIAIKI